MLGALTASVLTRRIGQGYTVVVALLFTQPVALLTPAAAPGPRLVLFALGILAMSFGTVVYNVAQVSFR